VQRKQEFERKPCIHDGLALPAEAIRPRNFRPPSSIRNAAAGTRFHRCLKFATFRAMTPPPGLLAAPLPGHVVRSRWRAATALSAFAVGLGLAKFGIHLDAGWWLVLAAATAGVVAFGAGGRGAAPNQTRQTIQAWVVRIAFVFATIAVGAAWGTLRWHETRTDSVANAAEGLMTVEAIVETSPRRVVQAQDGLDRFRIRPAARAFVVRSVAVRGSNGQMSPASGRLWVSLRGDEPCTVQAGNTIRLTGMFEAVKEPSNPGQFDLRPWSRERGFAGNIALSGPGLMQVVERAGWVLGVQARWFAWRETLRERAFAVVRSASRTGSAEFGTASETDLRREALVAGLILGVEDRASPRTWNQFTTLGLAHVLTVSGFHLVVMTTMAVAVLRLMGDIGRLEPMMVSAAIMAYLVLVPAESPIVRAGVLSLAVVAADSIGRKYDRLTLLLWVAVGLLVWRPIDLFSLGFQLSVGLTLVLIGGAAWFRDRLFAPVIRGVRVPRLNLASVLAGHLKMTFAAGLMCWLVSAAWIAHVTGIFSPLGVVATVVLTPPLVGAMWLGFGALLVGMVVPDVVPVCGSVMSMMVDPVLAAATKVNGWGWASVRVPEMGLIWTAAATFLAGWWVKGGRWRHGPTIAMTVVVLAWGGWTWNFGQRLPTGDALRIDVLDVSDGSCLLVRSGRAAVLWDCGSMRSDARGMELVRALRALGVSRVEAAVITHPDLDHFSRLPEVVEAFGVRRVLTCQRFVEQATSEVGVGVGAQSAAAVVMRLIEQAGAKVEVVTAGGALQVGTEGWSLTFISPPNDAKWERDNDHSLVAMVGAAGNSATVLLTGDIEDAAIGHLRDSGLVRQATIVEVPHHGSARAAAIEFVQSLQPRVMMQSSSSRRQDDDRWRTVRDSGLWMATCEVGAFCVVVNEDGGVQVRRVR